MIACAAGPHASSPVKVEIQRYLETVDHRDDRQKVAITSGRPFVGMTVEEADLAMNQERCDGTLDGNPIHAIYRGGDGARYYLYFEGELLRVVSWSSYPHDEIKLPDPREFRPIPPFTLRR